VHAVCLAQSGRLILLLLRARSRDKVERHPGRSYSFGVNQQYAAYRQIASGL
jgi:hypothetical protein